jgi:uncharacterized OsmC-like protein
LSSTGLIDTATVRSSVEDLAKQLAADPTPGIVRPKVMTRLIKDVTSEGRVKQYDKEFTFMCDEAIERAGRGDYPSPMRYFLSGIAFCLQVWYAKGAALVGCEVDSLEIDLHAFLDMRGEHLVDNVPPNPQYLILEARISSTSPDAMVLRMVDEGNRRCPVSNVVIRAIPIHERIFLNGRLIRDTVPPGRS